ncbi:MAG: MBL fold metallo-hydrolase [Peptococcaceae bacterium]|jgi:competence protein ComEC|nr:MBL fold metallo-hydrolase [Peptococcaceae bacterium]
MLKVDFINVGDGDAILLRRGENDDTYTVLVDCGRPYVEFAEGSEKRSCITYLMDEGVTRIDLLVLTHLHLDHIGGALAVLRNIPVARLVALRLPPKNSRWIHLPRREVKTVVGMCDVLNLWRDTVDFADDLGVICQEIQKGGSLELGDLRLRFLLPDPDLIERQRSVFQSLYLGETPPEDEMFRVSKERNCSSLIIRAEYAGRSVLLTGDAYASCLENLEFLPCDILKVPHHGDSKSMTEKLIQSLRPSFAVISCQNNPTQKKDRPCEDVMALLQRHVPNILCTENKELPSYPAATRDAARFVVKEDGTIISP